MATALEVYANQATTTVTSGGTGTPSPGTQETWTVASSSAFPAANPGAAPPTQFHIADTATGYISEIIAVTNVSGTTWTVTRGAEGTTPVAHMPGFTVQQVATAGGLGSLLASANNLSDVQSPASALTNLSALRMLATTGVGGYAFANGTASIITWSAPNDAALHRVLLLATLHVTSTQTGGQAGISITTPDGASHSFPSALSAGGLTGGSFNPVLNTYFVEANTAVTVSQNSAQSGGTAVAWVELWGL